MLRPERTRDELWMTISGWDSTRATAGKKRDLLPVEQVYNIVEIYPEACENCQQPLSKIRDLFGTLTRKGLTAAPPRRRCGSTRPGAPGCDRARSHGRSVSARGSSP